MSGAAIPTSNPPRLVYFGSVPVESTLAGSALLYRLLQPYPADRLLVVQNERPGAAPGPRLPGAAYDSIPSRLARLSRTRYSSQVLAFSRWYAEHGPLPRVSVVRRFSPQAILTVAHGFMCLQAARLARRLKLPLHLIIHDDVTSTLHATPQTVERIKAKFGEVYRQAATRWCVSPYMAELYAAEFGGPSEVLYPSRAIDGLSFQDPSPNVNRVPTPDQPLVFGYAGSIVTAAYAASLVRLAEAIEPVHGRVIVYSDLGPEAVRGYGMDRRNIDCRGLVPSREVITRLRQEADVLFLPMSFEPAHALNMRISFPSKLTDYTAAGLPLLIWGPRDCSAVQWATANPGVAEVVWIDDTSAIAEAAARLNRPDHRLELARSAIRLGQEYFGFVSAAGRFTAAIQRTGIPLI